MDNNEREACNAGGESSSGQEHVEDYDTLAFSASSACALAADPGGGAGDDGDDWGRDRGASRARAWLSGVDLPEALFELHSRNVAYDCERPISASYRGVAIGGQRVDLIVEGLIVVELKAVARLEDVHRSQLISYLRTLNLRGGLLINFHVPYLKQGLRRVVL